jgi:hypothetical protein
LKTWKDLNFKTVEHYRERIAWKGGAVRKKYGVIFAVIGLILLGDAEGWGADWRQYFSTEYGKYYFDVETLTYSTNVTLRTSVKIILTDKGVKSTAQMLGKEYENLEHTIQSLEINCATKTINILEVTTYSKTGDMISREENSSPDWRSTSPKTPNEALLKAACKQPKKQK